MSCAVRSGDLSNRDGGWWFLAQFSIRQQSICALQLSVPGLLMLLHREITEDLWSHLHVTVT